MSRQRCSANYAAPRALCAFSYCFSQNPSCYYQIGVGLYFFPGLNNLHNMRGIIPLLQCKNVSPRTDSNLRQFIILSNALTSKPKSTKLGASFLMYMWPVNSIDYAQLLSHLTFFNGLSYGFLSLTKLFFHIKNLNFLSDLAYLNLFCRNLRKVQLRLCVKPHWGPFRKTWYREDTLQAVETFWLPWLTLKTSRWLKVDKLIIHISTETVGLPLNLVAFSPWPLTLPACSKQLSSCRT